MNATSISSWVGQWQRPAIENWPFYPINADSLTRINAIYREFPFNPSHLMPVFGEFFPCNAIFNVVYAYLMIFFHHHTLGLCIHPIPRPSIRSNLRVRYAKFRLAMHPTEPSMTFCLIGVISGFNLTQTIYNDF
jgi:hypothetical protein